ncbi:MAG: methyltransferase domain-containing protein [Desulfarculales bacterium]|jgi:SAM-dependent methyltransferase|nr:methyltransferase domain-containing protein [Desulfarculales bacterium]
MRKFIFPYESIKKDSNIIIYGAGDAGRQFIEALGKTAYCNVLCVLDKNFAEKSEFPVKVLPPEAIFDIDSDDYSAVLIAISSLVIPEKARQYLLKAGVPENKILLFDNALKNTSALMKPDSVINADDSGNTFRWAVASIGGLGDDLIASILLKTVRKVVGTGLRVDFYCKVPELFYGMSFIDRVFNRAEYSENLNSDYDAVMTGGNFWRLERVNLAKARRFSRRLYDYFVDMIWHYENVFELGDSTASRKLIKYCAILGRNRWEQQNVHGILPLDRRTLPYMPLNPNFFGVLQKYALEGKRYLTVCDSVNSSQARSAKLWSNAKFNALLALLKQHCPLISVICIGENADGGEFRDADLDLRGMTTPEEMTVLLKYGVLHIGCEGGLIHLKRFMGGKSVCLFGPTSISAYGYPENINIRSDVLPECNEGCEWVSQAWLEGGCLLGANSVPAKCMAAISPQTVYRRIADYLAALQEYDYCAPQTLSIADLRLEADSAPEVALINRTGESDIMSRCHVAKKLTVFADDIPFPVNGRVIYEYGNIYNIPARDGAFDLVFNFTLAEEANPRFAFKEILRVVKPNGRVVIGNSGSGELKLFRKSAKPAKLILTSARPKVHFIRTYEPINAGDMNCGPLDCFPQFAGRYICLSHALNSCIQYDLIEPTDWVILGGSGLLEVREDYNRHINNLLNLTGGRVIAWSCGHNAHYGTQTETSIQYDKFALLTVRDNGYCSERGTPERWLPDVSCMMNLFDDAQNSQIVRRIGVIEHHAFPIFEFADCEKISNAYAVRRIIDFIATSEIIVTNTWHCLYWATLLNKKVILFEKFSNKFDYIKYPPTVYSGDLEADIAQAAAYPDALAECRKLNLAFYDEVVSLISKDDGQPRAMQKLLLKLCEKLKGKRFAIKGAGDTTRWFLKYIGEHYSPVCVCAEQPVSGIRLKYDVISIGQLERYDVETVVIASYKHRASMKMDIAKLSRQYEIFDIYHEIEKLGVKLTSEFYDSQSFQKIAEAGLLC